MSGSPPRGRPPATAEEIARHAGVAPRTFHRYFRSGQDEVSPLLADVRRPVAGTAGGGRARGRPVPGAAEAIRIAPESWAPTKAGVRGEGSPAAPALGCPRRLPGGMDALRPDGG